MKLWIWTCKRKNTRNLSIWGIWSQCKVSIKFIWFRQAHILNVQPILNNKENINTKYSIFCETDRAGVIWQKERPLRKEKQDQFQYHSDLSLIFQPKIPDSLPKIKQRNKLIWPKVSITEEIQTPKYKNFLQVCMYFSSTVPISYFSYVNHLIKRTRNKKFCPKRGRMHSSSK